MEAPKSVPPAFIIESCMLLDADVKLGQRQISPDMLRRMRIGEADEADLQQLIGYVSSVTNIDERRLLALMRQHPSTVAFLALSWCMVQQSKWNSFTFARMNDMAYISHPHLRFGLPAVPILPNSRITRSLATTHSILHMEVLTMQYRTLVQQLYKYKQLDLSRVNIMKDITGMVQDIFRNDPETSTSSSATGASTRDKSVSNPYTIGISSMNRLLENLWNSAELVSTAPARGAPGQKGKGGKIAKSKPDKVLGSSGVETLRMECDALKEAYSSAEQCTSSEVSYLKWASGGITPQHPYNTIIPITTTNTNATNTSTSRPNTANTLPPTPPLIPPVPIKRNLEEENLGKFVYDSTNMMGELEEYMLELMDSGGMLYEELCDISVSIDRSLAGVGLTVEDIDEYCSMYSATGIEGTDTDGNNSTSGTGAGVSSASGTSTSVNLFEYLDSTSNVAPSDSSDILHRHIQQQYLVPVASSQAELANLRQLHSHTMRRTANACGKYCPFEIVWRPEKELKSAAAK